MGKKYTNSWFFVFLVSVFFGANAFAAEDIVTITYAFATNNVSGIEVGGIVPAPTTCAKGQLCELTPMDMTDFYRGGHKLIGWGTTNSDTNTTAEYTTTGTFDKDTILYAVWEPCGVDTYHPDAAGMPANVCETCAYGSRAYIDHDKTQCTACAKGFTGVGCKDICPNAANVEEWMASTWNSDNTVSYKCSPLICDGGYSKTSDTDEYDPDADSNGTCEPITRELKFSLAAADATWADPTDADKTIEITFKGTLPELPFAQPSRNGYTFKGWWGDSESNLFGSRGVLVYDENGNPINEVLNDSGKFYDIIINRELSAKWKPNPVTITYSAGDFDLIGTLPQPTTCYYEQYCELAPLGTTFNRKGGGWWAPNWYDAEDKSATYGKCDSGRFCGTFTKDTTLIPDFVAFCPQREFNPGVVGVPIDRCQICARGSYETDGLSSGCIACAGGTTGDSISYIDKPPLNCPETCPNSDGVESWVTPEWSYTIDADAIDMSAEDPYANVVTNKVTNKCTIDTCKSGYKRVGSYDPDADSNGACEPIDVTITYVPDKYTVGTVPEPTVCKYMESCKVAHESEVAIYYKDGGKHLAHWQDENGEYYYRDEHHDNVSYKLTEDVTVHPVWAICDSAKFYPKELVIPTDECLSCPTGSHVSSYNLNTGCTVCPVGTTTLPGSRVLFEDGCKETCPNAANVATWQKPTWDFSIDSETRKVATNKVTNKCTIVECEDGYKRVGSYDPDAESNYVCVQDIGDTYFDIEYDYAGGYLSTAIELVVQCNMDSDEITLPTSLIRAGYTLVGWDYNGETVTTIPAGECNNDIKLTAQWTPKIYTVTYTGCDSITTTDEIAYGQAFAPKSCSKFGYDLLGWAVSGTSDIKNANESFDWEYLENKTLTAQWVGNGHYWITYDPNGGTFNSSNLVTECTAESKTIVLPTNVTRKGYTFAGWDNNGETVTTIPAGACDNNISLTAQWTPKTYTVTLDKNGGIGSADTSVKCVFDNGCLLPSTGLLQREGYETQNKWCENADGSGSCYTAGQTTDLNISYDATDTTLYAAWEPVIVAIKLIADNAATNQEQTVYMKYADGWYSDEDAKKAISSIGVTAIPTRPGYEFMGFQYDGTIIVDPNGKLLNKPTFTTHDIDATVIWEKSELKCAPGTEPDDNEEYCVPCQNGFDALGNITVSSWTQGCIIASCMYQGELYDLRNNECVQICPYYTYTDGTGSMIWNNKTKQCERNCIEGFIHW